MSGADPGRGVQLAGKMKCDQARVQVGNRKGGHRIMPLSGHDGTCERALFAFHEMLLR